MKNIIPFPFIKAYIHNGSLRVQNLVQKDRKPYVMALNADGRQSK